MNASGVLYLVCVETQLLDIVSGFRRLTAALENHTSIRVETVVLTGRPASALVQFAERVGADLIAAGSHGHGRLERLLLGSVSTGIVRNANCAVLVVPPAD
jgi:nucleotide-binding universal stress UspA family protein